MKLISYNVNGVRAAIKKDLEKWLKKEKPDVFCVQETKVDLEAAPREVFEKLGYHQEWFSAEKKGYSGVATFSKEKPKLVRRGIKDPFFDGEGRVLRTDFKDFTLLNIYFPSGSSSEERHEVKMQFLAKLLPFVKKLKKSKSKLIVVGDYNIVHKELDIHNPQRKDKPSGYRPEERAWMDDWFKAGFVDAYRFCHPEKQEFSWWSYRAGSRAKDKGWRIDYISVSKNISKGIKNSRQRKDAFHSDHCPVELEIKF